MRKLSNGDWEIANILNMPLIPPPHNYTVSTRTNWRKISDPPRNNTTILMYLNDRTRRIGSYSEGSYILWTYRADDDKWLERLYPTHWMYLPEGPQED